MTGFSGAGAIYGGIPMLELQNISYEVTQDNEKKFILKDISTVSFHPENLMIWANTVSDVLDEYYGE